MDKLQVFTSGKMYYLRDQRAYDPFLKYFLVPVFCFIEFNLKFFLSCGHFHLVKHLPIYPHYGNLTPCSSFIIFLYFSAEAGCLVYSTGELPFVVFLQ